MCVCFFFVPAGTFVLTFENGLELSMCSQAVFLSPTDSVCCVFLAVASYALFFLCSGSSGTCTFVAADPLLGRAMGEIVPIDRSMSERLSRRHLAPGVGARGLPEEAKEGL